MLRPGQAVAVCVLALLTIGVLMVNSAGLSIDPREPFTIEGLLLSRSTIYAGLAVLAMGVCALLPVRRLIPGATRTDGLPREYGDRTSIDANFLTWNWITGHVREYAKMWPLWACVLGLAALLVTVYVPGIERPRNGSHRWITLHVPGLDSIQPSELAKWGMVILIAWYGARYAARMKKFWLGLVPGLVAIGLVAGIIVVEDLGTGALVVVAAGVVLLAAGVKFWHLAMLVPVPVAGAVLAIVTNPYRMDRIRSFVDPYIDPQGKGFHMIQSMTAVANGKVFGRGLGHGLQKFGYLPEDTTDFLFAVVCEELGVAGAAIVLFLLGALTWAVWMIVRREKVLFLKLIGLGVLATIGVQAAINLCVVTGMGPTKGIALPLLSSGGTGWILTAAALGLVIAMDRAQRVPMPKRAFATRPSEPELSMPTLGAMAMSMAGATASVSMAEVKPEPAGASMVMREDTVGAVEQAIPDEGVKQIAEDASAEHTGGPLLTMSVDEAPVETTVAENAAEIDASASGGGQDDEEATALDLESDGSNDASELAQLDQPPSEVGSEPGYLFDMMGETPKPKSPEIIVRDAASAWLRPSEPSDGAL